MKVLFVLLLFILMRAVAYLRKEDKNIDRDNPYIHPEAVEVLPEDMRGFVALYPAQSNLQDRASFYEKLLKPILDVILSFLGLLLLSPIFLLIIIAIKIDDPGPVFFKQKRVGKNKRFFLLHKFRSMKMSTPHDMPTHLLANPEQYITRVGKFLRKSSLDELPQIWDIFRGKMSIVGPRPALWNQADLIAERDRWRANEVMPGLTGLAQISGRDVLEIKDKAEQDGLYTRILRKNNSSGLLVDVKCFFGTLLPVLKSEGIVEGSKI